MVSDLPAVDLLEWWMDTTRRDADGYIKKAEEYGSYDLHVTGEVLLHAMKNPPKGVDPREVGVVFYLLGKIARAVSAYEDGRTPSDDTWHDVVVYAMMARLFRKEAQDDD
jgi:hypothetical protein